MFTPSKQDILSHLTFLFSDAKSGFIEIAYTPSNSSAVNKAGIFKVSEIEKAAEFAFNQNSQEGVNVYVGAAIRKDDAPLMGRSNISDFDFSNAVWCDLDDADAARTAKEKFKDLPPSLVVVTGKTPNLRAQAWWKLKEPCSDMAMLKATLDSVCKYFSGDPAVVDPIRIMRLAGTVAWPKKDGRITENTYIAKQDRQTAETTIAALQDCFPAPVLLTKQESGEASPQKLNLQPPKLAISNKEGFTVDQVCDMLSHIHPDGKYLDWLKVGMGLKDYGVPFEIFDSWCSQGPKYEGTKETRYKWDSFKGAGTSIGTVYKFASERGYHPSNYKKQPVLNVPQTKKEDFDPDTGEIKKVSPPSQETFGRVLPLVYADEVQAETSSSDFVEDLLRDKEFSVIYGASNCGKTFFMLDLAMHVALGRKWRDKQVDQGGVIYAALEGGHGTKNRIVAFREHYGIKDKIPLAVIPSNINFLDTEGDVQALVNAIYQAQERMGNVKLIVIDTLARAIAGGDENSSTDMGALIINADKLREITNAHISFVHHSGKDDLRGARGHSSLRAAVDTEIEISRPDTDSPSTIKVVKQREMEMMDDMSFRLNRVVLGVNQRGKDVTSCIVSPCEVQEVSRSVKMNPIQTFIFDALLEAMIRDGAERQIYKGQAKIKCVSYDDLRLVMEERGFKEMMATEKKTSAEQVKSATQTARLGLKKLGKINFDNGFIWPIYEA